MYRIRPLEKRALLAAYRIISQNPSIIEESLTISRVLANSSTSLTWYLARAVLCVHGSGDEINGVVEADEVVLFGCAKELDQIYDRY
jgi:hypothetical protein